MTTFLIIYTIAWILTSLIAHICLDKDKGIFRMYWPMVIAIGFLWFVTWSWIAYATYTAWNATRRYKYYKDSN